MEGFMDVIALHRANIPQAIALMGTAVTNQHVKLLQSLGVEIRICLDQDQAGQMAMMKMIQPLSKANISFRFVIADKETRDADEILLTDGEKGLQTYLNQLVPKMDFSFHFYQKVMPLSSTEQRVAFINRMLPLIAISPELEQIDYLKRLGQLTNYALKDLQSSLKAIQTQTQDYFEEYRPEAKVLNRLKRAEKAILFNMFQSQDAINLYQANVKFFHDDIYRQIANYFMEIYQSDPPDHQSLINHISLSGSKDQQKIINTIAELMSEKNLPKADKQQLLDYLKTLNEERDKLVKTHQLNVSIAGKSETEQARIIKELHKQANPELTQGENDNEIEENNEKK
jgi:DNA primase